MKMVSKIKSNKFNDNWDDNLKSKSYNDPKLVQDRRIAVSAKCSLSFRHFCCSCSFAESIFSRNLRDDRTLCGREKELNDIKRQLLGDDDRFSSQSHALKFCFLVMK